MQCGQQSYSADPVQHARCEVAFATYTHDERNHDLIANAVGLGPTQSLGERALAWAGFLPFGVLGRGLAVGADAVRGLGALEIVDMAANAADSVVSDAVKTGRLGGQLYPSEKLAQLGSYLAKRGVTLRVGDEFLPPAMRGGFATDGSELVLGSNPTRYEVWHEFGHYIQYKTIGRDAYMALSRSQDYNAPEPFVFDMLENSPKRWSALTYEEQQHAIDYIERIGGFR